jgi:hypothetical protein
LGPFDRASFVLETQKTESIKTLGLSERLVRFLLQASCLDS